jgi:predicted unusual protein kinase regulating ubiquinone biosynthesis (AarF/ABC1/UbiB family)
LGGDGQVAVKVRHPDVLQQILLDFAIMQARLGMTQNDSE